MFETWRVVVVILLVGTLPNPGDTMAQGPQPPEARPCATAEALGSTPVTFIENVGHLANGARFQGAGCPV